jgi:hypothetical protein
MFRFQLRSWRCLVFLSGLFVSLEQVPALAEAGTLNRPVRQEPFRITATSETEPPEFELGTPGICRFYNLSGYLALAADGQLVPLKPYCEQQRNWVWYEEGRFWQRFRDAATSETLTFAQTLNRHEIESYALSICPFLEDGGTLSELRQIQTDNRLPSEFEQAITIAAVRTYCRQYRSQL